MPMLRCLACLLLAVLAPIALQGGEATAPDLMMCPACHGTGICSAVGCVKGTTPCPRTCLKKEVGKWEKIHVAGHSDDELWQTFTGVHGGHMWTQYHIGDLIEYENGDPIDRGKCPTCHGTTRVPCSSCSGTAVCAICAGAKMVTKAIKKTWEAAAKIEAEAQGAFDQAREAEKAAKTAKSRLMEVARNYTQINERYPQTPAGRQAKIEAERIEAALSK